MLILEDFTITVSLRNRFGMCCSLLPSYSKQFITALLHREQFSYFHIALHTLLNCHKPVPMERHGLLAIIPWHSYISSPQHSQLHLGECTRTNLTQCFKAM